MKKIVSRQQYLRQSLEKLLFFLSILFLPSQLGKHFWPTFSYVEGIRIDYLSPTLYLTDVLIGLLFFTVLFTRNVQTGKNFFFKKNPLTLMLISFLAVLLLGIYFSSSPLAGLYKLIKLCEFLFFGFYAANAVNKKNIVTITMVFLPGFLIESFLSIAQFVKQSSVGGILWFLGERSFSGQTPGIANAMLNGELILRPYGTFPHPNVLAAYLLLSMLLLTLLVPKVKKRKKLLVIFGMCVGTVGLFLTLSRVAILLWFACWLILGKKLFQKRVKNISVFLVFFVIVVSVAIFFTPLFSRFTSLFTVDTQSFEQRQQLNAAAIAMFRNSPIFGVGLNNFLVRLPDFQKSVNGPLWLQPVHNIYLLVLAETGIFGFTLFVWFLARAFVLLSKRKLKKNYIPPLPAGMQRLFFVVILFLGFFDHYFFTLQQGQLLFAVFFALLWCKKGESN